MNKIAFFVGSDLTSHIVLQDTLRILQSKGIKSEVFFPIHRINNKKMPYELQILAKYERGCLNEIIYPTLEDDLINSTLDSQYVCPAHFKDRFGVVATNISDINAISFKSRIFHEFNVVISIRCYQKFDLDYIEHFKSQNKFIWNLHPGDLPNYRGVMTCVRAMHNAEKFHTYTLHEMNTEWDAGPIIAKMPIKLNRGVSMLQNMCNLSVTGSKIIENVINMLLNGELINQDIQKAHRYYSFPDTQDFQKYKQNNISLYDHNFMMNFYIDMFFPKKYNDEEKIRNKMTNYFNGGVK